MAQVLQGSEPNEHGTWQYGRGGWCDGQEVNFAYCAFLQPLAFADGSQTSIRPANERFVSTNKHMDQLNQGVCSGCGTMQVVSV